MVDPLIVPLSPEERARCADVPSERLFIRDGLALSQARAADGLHERRLLRVNEPCRACGNPVTLADLDEAVLAGYDVNNNSRIAHRRCYVSVLKREITEWAHP